MQRTEKSELRQKSAPAREPQSVLPEYALLADMAAAFGSRIPAALNMPTLVTFSRAQALTPRRESPV